MKIKCPLETHEQQALIQWAQYHPICRKYLISYPLGGYRNKREGAKLKREGTRAGVSDLQLVYPSGLYHGLWIELKRRDKNLSSISKAQQQWISDVQSVGYAAVVCYGWEHAVDVIKIYLEE
jgi:VRR-NUC domain